MTPWVSRGARSETDVHAAWAASPRRLPAAGRLLPGAVQLRRAVRPLADDSRDRPLQERPRDAGRRRPGHPPLRRPAVARTPAAAVLADAAGAAAPGRRPGRLPRAAAARRGR